MIINVVPASKLVRILEKERLLGPSFPWRFGFNKFGVRPGNLMSESIPEVLMCGHVWNLVLCYSYLDIEIGVYVCMCAYIHLFIYEKSIFEGRTSNY